MLRHIRNVPKVIKCCQRPNLAKGLNAYTRQLTSTSSGLNQAYDVSNEETRNMLLSLAESTRGTLALETKVKEFCAYYLSLDPLSRCQLLHMLCLEYGINAERADKHIHALKAFKEAEPDNLTGLLAYQGKLRHALFPRYRHLFTQISRIDGGVKFLVDLRNDALNMVKKSDNNYEARPFLIQMDYILRQLLSLWFSVGYLKLERLTWTSPMDILQKVIEYEETHPIKDWADIKKRVGLYRRCFQFTHITMPREPIVVLHTALTNGISETLDDILKMDYPTEGNLYDVKEDPSVINTAMFYSITSTQPGLQGVELGNYLIKSAVKELHDEFPGIEQFSSLSPIPGFREWLLSEIVKAVHKAPLKGSDSLLLDMEQKAFCTALSVNEDSLYETLRNTLITNDWVQDPKLNQACRVIFIRLCARYLYQERQPDGTAVNSVANFHYGNGARLHRINWMADPSPKGLSMSCGIMVNYHYDLSTTDKNSLEYVANKKIAANDSILKILGLSKSDERP